MTDALNLSASDLLAHAAYIVSGDEPATTTGGAIRNDPHLNNSQKSALLGVYASLVNATPHKQPSTVDPVVRGTSE